MTTSLEEAGALRRTPEVPAQLAAALHPPHSDQLIAEMEALRNKIGDGELAELPAVDHPSGRTEREISFGRFRLLPGRRLLLEDGNPVRIGSRALDILIALVECAGMPVSKAELIAKGWPHAFVEEGNLKVQINALRRILADGQAGERYISTVAARGYCFVAPVTHSTGSPTTPAGQSAAGTLTNLPEPLQQLIGVDAVVSGLSEQLAQHRLVTLVGPGGIGKTSIVVVTAAKLRDNYEHGVWFADLSSIDDPRLVETTVGSAIRPVISWPHASASLLSSIENKRMLLVLDGCEHVIEAAAALVLQIMRRAPHLQILATSREPLSVEGELVHHLQALEMPPLSPVLSAANALEFPAIQLFAERATNVLDEFKLEDVDVPLVTDICRKLDGIPLAIGLAAASIDALGLQGVVSRLDCPMRLPATRSRTAAPRHRTLRATLDWSYRLLPEEERRVLRRLSIFADSFTMEEAAAVAVDQTYTENDIVDQVVALVAKSLVAADGKGSDSRMRLLTTTRAYAFEKLAESGEVDAIQRLQGRLLPMLDTTTA
jgi:predicted ATPase/DNA-binding winged helix-turn-helix (wHTH) protein